MWSYVYKDSFWAVLKSICTKNVQRKIDDLEQELKLSY